jgi:uroporphyrinogen-III synthase
MQSVLITSEREEPLASLLRDAGFKAIHCPHVRLEATHEQPPAGSPSVVVITSAAVPRFVPNLKEYIGAATVVAVGAATASALMAAGIDVGRVGEVGGVEAVGLVSPSELEGCWYIGAEYPSPGLTAALERKEIVRWSVYRNVGCEPVLAAMDNGYDVICFTSGSAVRSHFRFHGVPSQPIVVLGPSTAEVAEEHGMRVRRVADRPTLKSMVDAVSSLF